MSKRVDLVKGLIIRSERNVCSRGGDKKQANKLIKQLRVNFNSLLKEDNDDIFAEDFMKLISSKQANSYIANNLFPCKMEEYGIYHNIVDFTNEIPFEMRWLIYCIYYYRAEVSEFVKARETYDNCVLLNQYEEALDILNGIEDKLGFSLWGMECKFFIYSKMGMDKKTLMDQAPQSIFGSIMSFYELKNRDNVTSNEYFYIANKEVNTVKRYISDAEKLIDYFEYSITSLIYELNEEKISKILYVIKQSSLIDKYLFLLDVLDYVVSQPEGIASRFEFLKYIPLLDKIEDNHLIATRFILDTDENRKKSYIQKSRLDYAKTEFIKGNIEKARTEAYVLLQEFPNNVGAMNLYIEANILLGDKANDFKDQNLGILLNNLAHVYTLSEDRDDCIEVVNQLANACSHSTWANVISYGIVYRCQEYGKYNYRKAEILANIQHLDIETIIAAFDSKKSIDFIINKMDNENYYVKFRKLILNKDYDGAAEFCGIRQINDLLIVCDKNKSIEEKMNHLGKIEGQNASCAIMAMRNFLSTIDLNQNLDIAMKLSTGLIIDNIFTSLFIPLEKIVTYIDEGETEIRTNICTPILYYVYATYFNKEKIDDVGIICGDFFLSRDIEKPTKIDLNNKDFEKKELIYFLKNVCSSKIMDISISGFRNSQEREQERVEICNILSQIDPSNSKEYEKEIREVTQKLMINAELKIIEENRIHVNIDGMKDRLEKAYKNDFARYYFYQNERIIHWTIIQEGEPSDKLHAIQNTPERILRELVLNIRDAFVSSDEYGLNGYLSLNIRHGTLEDELRSPLYKSYLNAKKDIHSGKYIIHEHWSNFANSTDFEIIEKAIMEFHKKTEAIIAKLKGKYIQIRTEEKVTEGIFDYRIENYDFLYLSLDLQAVVTFEEFLDIIINYLWKRTEKNLSAIKTIIQDEIVQDYNNAFYELKGAISGVSNKTQLRELQQKITEASTDMPNTLDKICYWFQRSKESQHNDFDLQFAFNLGLQTIRNMHPEKQFIEKALKPVESDKIPGKYLKNFDGIFYNLFDNIYKKAISSDGRNIEIRYELKYKENMFHIYIENDFNCSNNISEDEERVERAKELLHSGEYLQRVKGEGGTGIPKIVKIIAYDLNRFPEIDFGYKNEKDIFFMKIEF